MLTGIAGLVIPRRGYSWVRRVTRDLAFHRIPIVLTDVRSASIVPLMAALRANYRPVYGDTLPPALHVVVWLPNSDQSGVCC